MLSSAQTCACKQQQQKKSEQETICTATTDRQHGSFNRINQVSGKSRGDVAIEGAPFGHALHVTSSVQAERQVSMQELKGTSMHQYASWTGQLFLISCFSCMLWKGPQVVMESELNRCRPMFRERERERAAES